MKAVRHPGSGIIGDCKPLHVILEEQPAFFTPGPFEDPFSRKSLLGMLPQADSGFVGIFQYWGQLPSKITFVLIGNSRIM